MRQKTGNLIIFVILFAVLIMQLRPLEAQNDWTCDEGPNDVLAAAAAAFEAGDEERARSLVIVAEEICGNASGDRFTQRHLAALKLHLQIDQGISEAITGAIKTQANLREDSTTDSSVLTSLAAGTYVVISEVKAGEQANVGGVSGNAWYKVWVDLDGVPKTGYVWFGLIDVEQTTEETQALSIVNLHGQITHSAGNPTSAYLYITDENYLQIYGDSTDSRGHYSIWLPWHEVYHINVSAWGEAGGYSFPSLVPVTVDCFPNDSVDVQTDIALQPAGNLILNAFTADGELLRLRDFTEITNNHNYATGLDDLPQGASFMSIHDAYSSNRGRAYDLGLPDFAIPLQSPTRLHVQWEVPGFGRIIVILDDSGKGYTLSNRDEYKVLNLNYEAAKSELALLRREYDAFLSSDYTFSSEILKAIQDSESHLRTAEELLAQPLPDGILISEEALAELNSSLAITLATQEQLHLEKAQIDIERNRVGYLHLTVVDEQGQPILKADITFQQVNHDFLFGANPSGKHSQYDPKYIERFKELGLNYAYILAAWESLEPRPGQFDWSYIDQYQNLQAHLDAGLHLLGGLALWFNRGSGLGYQFCPQYQDTMSFPELKTNIYDHMYAAARRYQNDIDAWEINEQNMPWANALDLTWDQKIESYHAAIEGIHDGNPNSKIIFTSAALPYEFGVQKPRDTAGRAGDMPFPEFLDLVISNEVIVDAIGLEFYYSGVNTDGYAPPGLSLASKSRLLDFYTRYDRPIIVRELSAPSAQHPRSNWWHTAWNEQTQAEFVEKFYTIAFSKSLVRGIGWSYGFSDENAFIQSGGLMNADVSPKPAFYTLKTLIELWTTTGSGETDAEGELLLQGFAGDYEITVTTSQGQSWNTRAHVYEQETNELTISVPSD